MADTRQTNLRLDTRTLAQINDLRDALGLLDPLRRQVTIVDVIRHAVDVLHEQKCRSVRGRRELEKLRNNSTDAP